MRWASRTVIIIPETQSQEKKDALTLLGAELIQVPAKPYKDPNNYVKLSGRLANKLAAELPNGAIWANQFDNVANRRAHLETTGPEIWRQTDGKIDGFICSVGSGRDAGRRVDVPQIQEQGHPDRHLPTPKARRSTITTRMATSNRRAIRSPKASARAASPLISTASKSIAPIRCRTPKPCPICSICSNMRASASAARRRSISPARCGSPRELGPGKTIVTILCDYGNRYQSKLYNPVFLKSKGLPVPHWLEEAPSVDWRSVVEPEPV